tara:strand:+ start:390 stop:716 length:327 start_codon:yes stop_codon:yes gene_type:complete
MDVCLKEAKRIEYEDLYRKAWDAQRKRDAAIDPRLRLKEDEKKKRSFHVLPKDRPLTNFGRKLDRLARNGMDVYNISIALNISEPEVRRIMKDYALPRETYTGMAKKK